MLTENMLGGVTTFALFRALIASIDSGGTRSTMSAAPVSIKAMREPSSGTTLKSIALSVAG